MPKQPTTKQKTTKLRAPSERLMGLLGSHLDLRSKLLEALETGHFFITISCQKKDKPEDPHDLKHFWIRAGYMPNDVVLSLRHLTADFCAKEMPNADVNAEGWH